MFKKKYVKHKIYTKRRPNYFILKNKEIDLKVYRYLALYLNVSIIKVIFPKKQNRYIKDIATNSITRYFNTNKLTNIQHFILKFKFKKVKVNKNKNLFLFSKLILPKYFSVAELLYDFNVNSIENQRHLNFFNISIITLK